jgi:hypothetical protein
MQAGEREMNAAALRAILKPAKIFTADDELWSRPAGNHLIDVWYVLGMIPPKGFVLGKPELPGDGTLNWKKMPRRKKRQCQPGVKKSQAKLRIPGVDLLLYNMDQ